MFTNIATWISRITSLALMARSTYTELKETVADLEANLTRYKALYSDQRVSVAALRKEIAELNASLAVAVDTLHRVEEQETSSANGTTKRMAKIAREGIAMVTGA